MDADQATERLGLDLDPAQFLFDADAIIAAVSVLGWPEAVQADSDRTRAQVRQALEGWVRLGLPWRDDGSGRRFDFGQVSNFMRRESLEGRDRVYLDQVAPAGRRMTAGGITTPPPAGGPSLTNPRRYRIILRREFNLVPGPQDRPARLRLPAPYPDPTQTDIEIAVEAPGGATVSTAEPGRIEVRTPWPSAPGLVAVEATYGLTAFELHGGFDDVAGVGVLSPAERELWLNPAEGLIRVTPDIRSLAETLAAACPDDRSMLAAFWDFFLDRLRCGYIRHYELDSADPLADLVSRGWFDCLGGSSLFIALCRARGLPARLVRGIMLHEPAPAIHYWAEVHLAGEGWVPVDPVSWDHAQAADQGFWKDLLIGHQARRMKFEMHPRRVVGPVAGVRLPRRWASLLSATPGGSCTALHDVETGELVYRDIVQVATAEHA